MRVIDRIRNFIKRSITGPYVTRILGNTKAGVSSRSSSFLEKIYLTVADELSKIDLILVKGTSADDFEVMTSEKLHKILSLRPNLVMSATDLMHIIGYQLLKYGNSITIIDRDEYGEITGLSPLDVSEVSFGNSWLFEDGSMLLRYRDREGRLQSVPYSDVIHIRLNSNDAFSFEQTSPITGADRIVKVFDESLQVMLDNLASASTVKGVLKLGTPAGGFAAVLNSEAKEETARDVSNRIRASKDGILVIDSSEEFTPIQKSSSTMTAPEINELLGFIYELKGINRNVVSGKANAEELEIFWVKCIHPIVDKLLKELNYKLLSDSERDSGIRIEYSHNVFEFLPLTKAIDQMYKGAMFLTPNEVRTLLFKLPPTKDGDERMQNLNFIDKASSEGGVKN